MADGQKLTVTVPESNSIGELERILDTRRHEYVVLWLSEAKLKRTERELNWKEQNILKSP